MSKMHPRVKSLEYVNLDETVEELKNAFAEKKVIYSSKLENELASDRYPRGKDKEWVKSRVDLLNANIDRWIERKVTARLLDESKYDVDAYRGGSEELERFLREDGGRELILDLVGLVRDKFISLQPSR